MSIPVVAWSDCANRVVIQVASYLEFDGGYSIGGRQRFIRDLALEIQAWGRSILIIQKGIKDFETTCPSGIPVIGLKSPITAVGDPEFSWRVRRYFRPGDVLLYGSGEDAWPFFRGNSKAIQHGIWWDGPTSAIARWIQRRRAFSMLRHVRSVLCVDTNFINWVRTQGAEGYSLASRCRYIPNYVDLSKLGTSRRQAGDTLRIFCARRFEKKRGTALLLDALGIMTRRGIRYTAHICTTGGLEFLSDKARDMGLANTVSLSTASMDDVLAMYPQFHVAVVPSLWSEGTSLAAAEALGAGLPVVGTPVGGLGNLIMPEFNGLLVQPAAEAMASALSRFSNFDDWSRMHLNALSMREALGFERWRKQVRDWLAE